MKILILGSWQRNKAEKYKKEAEEVGKELAIRGHILVSGGGTGTSEFVVNSYKKKQRKEVSCIFS
jgi:predicted Rossmann-fold nucleotide-binding protein